MGTLRRFEMYGFRDVTTPEQVEELARVLRDTGRFIPEVHDSATGRNRSDVPVALVWEHSYESPEAYERYMRHPFHICVLDRYLLPESPECITESRRELRLGLVGYEVDGHPFRRRGGVRRIVALKLDPGADPADAGAFLRALERRTETVPELRVSVVAPNSMGLEWFPDAWTHVWEQAYDDDEAMARGAAGEARALAAGPVAASAVVHYRIEAGPGSGAGAGGGAS